MEKQYIITERAHFMCPNMHFGMLAEIAGEYCLEKVQDTLNQMAAAHPFLRSVIRYEENSDKLYYDIKEKSMGCDVCGAGLEA